jgi:hypothetical protein
MLMGPLILVNCRGILTGKVETLNSSTTVTFLQ